MLHTEVFNEHNQKLSDWTVAAQPNAAAPAPAQASNNDEAAIMAAAASVMAEGDNDEAGAAGVSSSASGQHSTQDVKMPLDGSFMPVAVVTEDDLPETAPVAAEAADQTAGGKHRSLWPSFFRSGGDDDNDDDEDNDGGGDSDKVSRSRAQSGGGGGGGAPANVLDAIPIQEFLDVSAIDPIFFPLLSSNFCFPHLFVH